MEEPEREEGADGREHTAGLHPAHTGEQGKKLADHDPADTRSPLGARHCCSVRCSLRREKRADAFHFRRAAARRGCCQTSPPSSIIATAISRRKERSRVHLAAKPATAFFEIDLYQSKQNLSYKREQQQNKRQNLKVTCRRSRPEFLTPDIFHRHTRNLLDNAILQTHITSPPFQGDGLLSPGAQNHNLQEAKLFPKGRPVPIDAEETRNEGQDDGPLDLTLSIRPPNRG
nr:transcription activator GLK2-like isoform X3 [Ipomoea batatas]